MNTNELKDLVINSLEDLKAVNIQSIDLADKIHDDSKAAGHPPLGIEGEDSRDWVLVDLGDIIVHLMRPETRELYALEKLWSLPPTRG